jgi:zinc transporter 1/2/3
MIPMVSEAVAGRKARWVMSLLNAFSGGVFLSAGLTHLFPHLVEYQEQVKITPAGYPAGFALALTGYLLVFFIERVLFHIHGHAIHPNGHDDHCCETSAEEGKKKGQHHHHEHSEGPQTCEDLRKSKRPYILLAAISVHSVLAGLTLGVQKSRQNVLTIFTAIAAHKAPAALSIGSSFVNGKASKMVSITSMIVFSLTTTCGIFIGMGVGSVSIETVFVLEALASGTFLYGGTSEIVADEFEMSDRDCDEHGGDHVKKVHAGRSLSQRLALFTAYAGGAGVILLSNLSLDGEHSH